MKVIGTGCRQFNPRGGRHTWESAVTPRWAIFTNHGHVLIYVWNNPAARIRDIAQAVGLTERTTLVMLRDLVDANYLTRVRSGKRNRYTVRQETPLHHPVEQGRRSATYSRQQRG